MAGLTGYAAYVPVWRVDPAGRGAQSRVTASFDEDSTTMAAAAARAALRGHDSVEIATLAFATSTPAYLDKTNAAAVHAALQLPRATAAVDLIGTARSTCAAIRAAAVEGGVVVAADVRVGRSGSVDERDGADLAGALVFGDDATSPVIAEILATASVTDELLDRWRSPLRRTGEQWEERFGYERYRPLIADAAATALRRAALAAADHVVLVSPNSGVRKRAASLVPGAVSSSGMPGGHSGAADPIVALAAVLDVAEPEQTILLLSASDGCDAVVFRTTAAIVAHRQAVPVAAQLRAGRPVSYPMYLSWRGLLEVEPPRRPEPERPAAPPTGRSTAWKFGFVGGRCAACGMVHLPPARVCHGCGEVDRMVPAAAADRTGTVATYTVDRLAYSPSPPVVDVVVDVEGGGRITLELADADPAAVEVGTEVEFVFRTLFTAGDVHDYFWKARVTAPRCEEQRNG